jgi:hypothetical protein
VGGEFAEKETIPETHDDGTPIGGWLTRGTTGESMTASI